MGVSSPDVAFYDGRFERLKRDGCAILVTGEVPPATRRAATRLLFGAPDEPRRRVLAVTDAAVEEPAGLLPTGVHPADERVRVVDRRDVARSATPDEFADSPFAAPGHSALDEIHLGVCNALAAVTPEDPDGGEVRLSVASLPPLLRRHDDAAVRRFVRSAAAHVRGLHGMAHFLLPVADGAGWVRRLTDEVDARVELRAAGGDGPPEHRWHFPEREQPSPWRDLPVADDHGWTDR